MTAHTGLPFDDPFAIGQIARARITRDIAEAGMAEHAPDAFSTGYMPEAWRAMKRRLFAQFRADYERATDFLRMNEALE